MGLESPPLPMTSCISMKTTTGECWQAPPVPAGHTWPCPPPHPPPPKVPDMTLVVGSGRSEPSPSPHPTVTHRGEGLRGWGGRLLLCSGMVDGGGGGGRSAGTLSSIDTSRLLPASHPLHCCFLCFLGVRGTLDYTSSFREPCVSGGRSEGARGVSQLARHCAPFC